MNGWRIRPGGWLVVGAALGLACGVLSACGESDGATGGHEPGVEGGSVATAAGGDNEFLVRNVVLISLDTLRADRLEPYGYERNTSPQLDAFAEGAFLFRQARAQSSQTAPSHASLFTSEFPAAHGVVNVHGGSRVVHALPPNVTTLAELLGEAEISTAAFVSGGNLTRSMQMDRGFSHWDQPSEQRDVSERAESTLHWIEEQGEERFFVLMHTYQVHAPYLPPPEVYPAFVEAGYEGPLRDRLERYLTLSPDEQWVGGVGADYWEGMVEWDAADVAFLSDLYDAEIRYTDSVLGPMLKELCGGPRGRDTAVIVLADHGEEFREHRKFQHDQLYEEHLHVPLLVRMPEPLKQQGWFGVVQAPVDLIDVAPTVAELMGVAWDGTGWEGRSLLPLMRPGGEARRAWQDGPSFARLVLDLGDGPGDKIYRSVSWQGWKYIHVRQPNIDTTWESLFDLESDPREQDDLLARDGLDDRQRERLAALRKLLDDHEQRARAKAVRLGEAAPGVLDDSQREQLQQLGYAGSDDDDD